MTGETPKGTLQQKQTRREKKREKKRKRRGKRKKQRRKRKRKKRKMSRVNYYQYAFNSQKEKLNI